MGRKIFMGFSLSKEIVDKLEGEENKSAIVESLLEGHFKNKLIMTDEERDKEIEKLEAQLEYEKKLEEINAKYNPE